MIKGEDIVYITSDWQRENKTSTHHIAEELSKHNRLLYIEAAGMRAPRVSTRDLRKILGKLRKLLAKPVLIDRGFYLYSPFLLPLHRYRLVRWLNSKLVAHSIKRAMRYVGFDNPLLWIFMPHFSRALSSIPGKGLVYYITDEYTATPHVEAAVIQSMENEILKRADVVFAVSEKLRAKKSELNTNVYISPHGVDIEHFEKATAAATRIPDDASRIPKPIAGFFGLIESYIDLDLVHYLASTMDDVSFVLIGQALQDISKLKSLPNVFLLGHRPYGELPGYLKSFDVSMLLYRIGDFSMNANPKKLREYLAGGKPIVSVRIPEVERYAELVYIADTYEDFSRCIREAITNDSKEAKQRRQASMNNNSWSVVAKRLGETIAKHVPSVSQSSRE